MSRAMGRTARWILVLAVLLPAACLDMDVVNVNNPDARRALSNPDDVQSLLGGGFLRWWRGAHGIGPANTLAYAGEELTTGFGSNNSSGVLNLPRSAWPNEPGSPTEMDDMWTEMYGAISQVNDGLSVLDQGVDFGPDGRDNLRARAFGRFIQGLAHGWLAMTFDRAYVVDETLDPGTDPIALRPYAEVMDAAIAYLLDAIELSESGSFTFPATWTGDLTLTNQDLVRISHSYIARFLTTVARDPAERAAVDWDAVITHANQGITQDFAPLGSGTSTFYDGPKWRSVNGTTRVSYIVIGPADTTGAFAEWYAGPPQDRVEFDMAGPDLRIHAAGDPEAPGLYIRYDGPSNHAANQSPHRWGRYILHRYEYHLARVGPMPIFLVSELDFLKAEAYYRLGDREQAAALVNLTRVNNGGLPPVQADDPALFEKLIYDKRIELLLSSGGSYFDARGWGLLHEGSPIHFPIPALQLELINEPVYTFGGDNPGSAPPRSVLPVAVTPEDMEILRNQ